MMLPAFIINLVLAMLVIGALLVLTLVLICLLPSVPVIWRNRREIQRTAVRVMQVKRDLDKITILLGLAAVHTEQLRAAISVGNPDEVRRHAAGVENFVAQVRVLLANQKELP